MFKGFENEIKTIMGKYFSATSESERKENWNKLMAYFQFHIHNPRDVKFRIIKNREQAYPILIFKNHVTQSKLLIPVIPNRIIKLNLSDFVNTGVTADILDCLTFDNRIYKVYNDIELNKKPILFENTAS